MLKGLSLVRVLEARDIVEQCRNHVGHFATPEARHALAAAEECMNEVQHFVSTYRDNEENRATGAVNGVVADRIKAQIIQRLIDSFRPELEN